MKADEIGCGWCARHDDCTIRNPKVNKAKDGCPDWIHWEDDPSFDIEKSQRNLKKFIDNLKSQKKQ